MRTFTLLLAALLLPPALLLARAGEEGATVPAVIYEVFHGDSLHGFGWHVREIHVPSRNLAFYVDGNELRVLRPGEGRYHLPGDTEEWDIPGEGKFRVPVLFFRGQETRRVGEIRIRATDVDRLEKLLLSKTALRAVADGYLQGGPGYETVAAFGVGGDVEANRVAGALDRPGILWASARKEGVVTVRVPPDRAEEARRILLAADPTTGYRVLYADGSVVWEVERTTVPPTPPDADVLEHLAHFPGSMTVEGGRKPKYGDVDLEEAEQALKDRLPRPWTVAALRKAYADAEPGATTVRAALITLLAASRRPEALPQVGAALGDEELEVRVAATTGILEYWDPGPLAPAGNLESMMDRADEWWKARRK